MAIFEGVNRNIFVQPDPVQSNFLLKVAHAALEKYLQTGEISREESADPVLNQQTGVFVTLMQIVPDPDNFDDQILQLRGCIGNTESDQPLWELVPTMAVKAATEDPRFTALTLAEVEDILIEISILSPLKLVNMLDEIEMGVHGLLLAGNGRRGLLLPKVPLRFGWSRTEFLQNLCQKADLPIDFWPRFGKLEAFTTFNIADPVLMALQNKKKATN